MTRLSVGSPGTAIDRLMSARMVFLSVCVVTLSTLTFSSVSTVLMSLSSPWRSKAWTLSSAG